jgi:transcriptional regulator with XRE-family HTH domain
MYGCPVAIPVAKAVGVNAQAIRRAADVNLEQFALAATLYGLPWTTGRVGDFESGRVSPSFPTLYAVAAALGHAIGRPVSLLELFAGDGPVEINDRLIVDLSELRSALSGEAVSARAKPKAKLSAVVTPNWAGISPTLHLRVLNDFREADARICKSAGVAPDIGAAVMAKLWRRTFTAKRDQLAGPDANAQRKGQISRQLKAELEKALADGNHQ